MSAPEDGVRVFVAMRPEVFDAEARQIEEEIRDLSFSRPVQVRLAHWYRLYGRLEPNQVRRLAEELLIDPVVQQYAVEADPIRITEPVWAADIGFLPGVTDPVGESVQKGARDLGVDSLERVETGRRVYFFGDLSREEVEQLCRALLVNDVIHALTVVRLEPESGTGKGASR